MFRDCLTASSVIAVLFAAMLVQGCCIGVCTDVESQMYDTRPESIYGRWEWVGTWGGITGKDHRSPETEGYRKELVFRSDSFFVYIDGEISESGETVFDTVKSIFNKEDVPAVKLGHMIPLIFKVDGDDLTLTMNCYDCYGHRYHRVSRNWYAH